MAGVDKNTEEVGSEKSFGIVFFVVFLIIGLYPLLYGIAPRIWSLLIAFTLLIIAFMAPRYLHFPNRIWFHFGHLLGVIMTPVVLFIIYYLTVIPTGMLVKLFGGDLLDLKRKKDAKTYWRNRKEAPKSMKYQF